MSRSESKISRKPQISSVFLLEVEVRITVWCCESKLNCEGLPPLYACADLLWTRWTLREVAEWSQGGAEPALWVLAPARFPFRRSLSAAPGWRMRAGEEMNHNSMLYNFQICWYRSMVWRFHRSDVKVCASGHHALIFKSVEIETWLAAVKKIHLPVVCWQLHVSANSQECGRQSKGKRVCSRLSPKHDAPLSVQSGTFQRWSKKDRFSAWPAVSRPKPTQDMGVSQKIGLPQNGWFIMKNLINMDDLGVPLFSETSISNGSCLEEYSWKWTITTSNGNVARPLVILASPNRTDWTHELQSMESWPNHIVICSIVYSPNM